MPTPHLAIPANVPGLRRAKETIADHQRRARDNHYLACRVLTIANSDPSITDLPKMVRLARLLDTTAWYHARKAQDLANKLAEVAAAFQP